MATHTFPIVWVFFLIQFPFCGRLHYMVNAWVYSLISHSTGKWNKTYCIGRNWGIGTHTFHIAWVLFFSLDSHPMVYFIIWEIYVFSHRFPAPIIFPSCGILHHTGNALVSPSISQSTEITNTFSIAWVLFSH